MSPKQLAADIRIRLFADRGTDLQSAIQYADQVFKSLGTSNIPAQTAMHVVLNTIANILDEMLDPADNPATGTPVEQVQVEHVQLQLDRAALDDIIDSRVQQWIEDNGGMIEAYVEEWFSNNVDIEHEVDEAIRNIDFEVRIR